MTARDNGLADAMEGQADACDRLGSPFTAALLRRCVGWLDSGHPIARHLRSWPDTVRDDAVPLRLAGALHALVLSGRAPDLARHYPGHGSPAGETGFDDATWAAVLAAFDAHMDWITDFLDRPPQTNEVARAGAIMASLLYATSRHDLPIVLFEAGASGGLNLALDRFDHDLGGTVAGSPGAPVTIRPDWRGPPPPNTDVRIAERRGVDASPVDFDDPDARLRLASYIWPDQPERLQRQRAAIDVARSLGLHVERGTIGDWVPDVLSEVRTGRLTVLYHTIVWQYVGPDEKARAEEAIALAGARASEDAPFARLAIEWDSVRKAAPIQLSLWPGGEVLELGLMHAHAAWVEWFAPDA